MLQAPLVLTRAQVRRFDELAIQRLQIPSIVLMENAGRNAAELIHQEAESAGSAMILCGTGNNGGDGFVIARHLVNRGWTVRVAVVGDPERFTPDAGVNHRVLCNMGVGIELLASPGQVDDFSATIPRDVILIDALLGTGFTGEVRDPMATLIQAVNNARPENVIAVDVPSGVDCDTGRVANVAVRADLTVTFVAQKPAFDTATGREYAGRVVVVDIGAPLALAERILEAG